MIGKNHDIRGIAINNRQYKLSRYADDTQLFLNASEKSFKTALNVLQTFYKISGLKINVEKNYSYLNWYIKPFRKSTMFEL